MAEELRGVNTKDPKLKLHVMGDNPHWGWIPGKGGSKGEWGWCRPQPECRKPQTTTAGTGKVSSLCSARRGVSSAELLPGACVPRGSLIRGESRCLS